jgi:hypothetical protein
MYWWLCSDVVLWYNAVLTCNVNMTNTCFLVMPTVTQSIYMPLKDTQDSDVYMMPELHDSLSHSTTPQPPDGEDGGEAPALTNGGSTEEQLTEEPLYMMPGDHVYYDDSGVAVPLATADTYAVLTNTTKLEEAVYAVRMKSPTPEPPPPPPSSS